MLSMLDRRATSPTARIRCGWCSSRKTSRIDENEFVNLLLAKTSMETNAPINLVMVGLDGRPTGKNLRDIARRVAASSASPR